jgi:hypothetical protein
VRQHPGEQGQTRASGKWQDEAGRWREANGRFTKPPTADDVTLPVQSVGDVTGDVEVTGPISEALKTLDLTWRLPVSEQVNMPVEDVAPTSVSFTVASNDVAIGQAVGEDALRAGASNDDVASQFVLAFNRYVDVHNQQARRGNAAIGLEIEDIPELTQSLVEEQAAERILRAALITLHLPRASGVTRMLDAVDRLIKSYADQIANVDDTSTYNRLMRDEEAPARQAFHAARDEIMHAYGLGLVPSASP